NLVFEGVKDGGNALSEAARTVLDSPIETSKNMVQTVEHTLSDCLKNPLACATEKWATFDSASGDLLKTHYNQADVNALYGKDMTAETALVPLIRGGTVVAEVLPVVKAGSVAVKSVDNMLSPLVKGVDANEKLPVVGEIEGYNQTTTYFRVEGGGEGYKTSVNRINVNNDGTITINSGCQGQLCVSAKSPNHALYYLTEKRKNGTVVVFEVDKSLHQEILATAIPQKPIPGIPRNPNAPKIVDEAKGNPSINLELPKVWDRLIEKHSSKARVLTEKEFKNEFGKE
ncbi:hypothetical protein, partial [Testudinibacter aquarius]